MENKQLQKDLQILARAMAEAILSIKPEDFAKFISESKTHHDYENVRSLSPVQ